MEGAQQVRPEGVPETELGCGAIAEERPHVNAVGPFRCGGQAQQFHWLEVIDDSPVRRRFGMVELIDDDDLEGVGRDIGDAVRTERLNTGEDVAPPLWAGTADVQLAERRVRQDLSVGAQ